MRVPAIVTLPLKYYALRRSEQELYPTKRGARGLSSFLYGCRLISDERFVHEKSLNIQ